MILVKTSYLSPFVRVLLDKSQFCYFCFFVEKVVTLVCPERSHFRGQITALVFDSDIHLCLIFFVNTDTQRLIYTHLDTTYCFWRLITLVENDHTG